MTEGNGAAENAQDSKRLGAIDVGTNSLRLVIASATPDGNYRVLDDEKEITRLGAGLGATGLLGEESMQRSATVIGRMREIAEGFHCQSIRAIATAAVREADNGQEFVDLVREVAGVELEVISAREEARLAYRSASHAFDISQRSVAIVDIGGGSTEIVVASNGVIEQVYTLPIGAVRLTERYHGVEHPENSRRFEELRAGLRRIVREHLGRPPVSPQEIIGTGGTFTTLAGISAHKTDRPDNQGEFLPFALRGYEMQRSEIRHILEHLRKLSVKARTRVPGLSADRAEIIVAGVAIIDAVMKRLGVNTARIHDRGIRDGLVLEMIDEAFPVLSARASQPVDRWQSVRAFAARCRYEEHHSHHVAELSTSIFDQLAAQVPELFEGRVLLEQRDLLKAAAILHDVGYFVNYSKHHKHTYHLIVHSEINGFDHRDLELIANIARYHRRAEPKRGHKNFAKLTPTEREIVRKLAGILRIAVGLDRTHTQTVTGARLGIADGRAVFELDSQARPEVDIWGAQSKSRLFERAFDLAPEFRWDGPNGQPAASASGFRHSQS